MSLMGMVSKVFMLICVEQNKDNLTYNMFSVPSRIQNILDTTKLKTK